MKKYIFSVCIILFSNFISITEAKTKSCTPSGDICNTYHCVCCSKKGINCSPAVIGPPLCTCK